MKNLPPRSFSVSWAVYERLLLAYPRAHRREYGPAMAQLFRDQCRDAWTDSQNWGLLKLWLRILPDLAATSILERLAGLKERKSMNDRLANLSGFRIAPAAVFFKLFALVFLLVFGASIVITCILPESYASTARVKVDPDPKGPLNSTATPESASNYDPYFIQTTFEILRSQVVLGPVIDQLQLNDVWGKKYNGGAPLKSAQSMEMLKARLDLAPIRNTSIASITVYSEDRDEAARIANAIAGSFRDYRVRSRVEASDRALQAMWDQYQNQEAQIQETTAGLDSLRQKYNIAIGATEPQSLREHPYWDKKRDLDTQLEFHKLLAAKIDAAKLDRETSLNSGTEIIDTAHPGNTPVRPNKPLNITLGALTGIFLASVVGGFFALIASWSGKRIPPAPAAS